MADHQIRRVGKDPSTLLLAGVLAAPLIGPCLCWICFAVNLAGVALAGFALAGVALAVLLLIQVSMEATYTAVRYHTGKSPLSTSRIRGGSARGTSEPAPAAIASTSRQRLRRNLKVCVATTAADSAAVAVRHCITPALPRRP